MGARKPGHGRPWTSLRALQLLLGCCLVQAGTVRGEPIDEQLLFDEVPIVFSPSRLPQRLADAPAAVTVIDREMIKASGARDLSDVLRLVPGFQTFARNTESPRVTYHGIPDSEQSSRIQVLIDGRSQFSPLFGGGVHWSVLPVALEDIERIEVTRGSNAASYGGNAFQAMVNIVTIEPALTQGTSLAISHGNQGVRDELARLGGRLGDSGHFRLTYQARRDTGLTDRADWQDGYQSQAVNWRSDLNLDTRNQLQVDAGHMRTMLVQGRLGQEDNPIRNAYWQTAYAQILWRHIVDAQSEWQLRHAITEDRIDSRYEGRFGSLPFVMDPDGSRALRQETELVHHHQWSPTLRWVWGLSHRDERVDSPLNFTGEPQRTRNVQRIFANTEWKPLSQITANLGLSTEHDSVVGWLPATRFALNFHLHPEHTLRLAMSRNQRSGSLMDYQANQNVVVPGLGTVLTSRGTPDLGTEQLRTAELGYLGHWKSLGLQLDARVFDEHIPNRWFTIERRYADCLGMGGSALCLHDGFSALRSPVALQDVHIRGLEYQLNWSPSTRTRVNLGQAFVDIRADYLDSALNDPANAYLRNSEKNANLDQLTERSAPSRATTILLMQKLPLGLDFSVLSQWVGNMKWTTNTAAARYHRVDLRLGYPFRVGSLGGELAYTAQSINGSHGEYDNRQQPADRIVEQRHWITLRLDL